MRRLLFLAVAAGIWLSAVTTAAAPFPQLISPRTGSGRGIAIDAATLRGLDTDGAVYRGDLRTGEAPSSSPASPGPGCDRGRRRSARPALHRRRPDRESLCTPRTEASGQLPARVQSGWTFINDVVLTRDAAWFTDSFRHVLYRIAIAERHARPVG
jgi:hypothetical protein